VLLIGTRNGDMILNQVMAVISRHYPKR